jgi:tetratricopeptide (TPR) repeat protein
MLTTIVSFANAQERGRDPAAAQALFDAAQTLKKEKRFEEACAKFSESQNLDPQVGTQLNLADCYERIGKTASAWVNFVEVADAAKLAGQTRRAEEARRRAAALEPGLSKLSIEVESGPPDLEVRRDGIEVGRASWGMPTPVDPGEHDIVASAPGKQSWSVKKQVEAGETTVVRVPALADVKNGDGPTPPPSEPIPWKLVLGGSLMALGVAGLTVGTAFAVIARNKNDESLAFCRPEDPNVCQAPGVALRNQAEEAQIASIVGFGIGGALLVGGVVFLVLGLTDQPEDQVTLTVDGPGLTVRGRF